MLKTKMKETSIIAYFSIYGKGIELSQKGEIFTYMKTLTKPISRTELSEILDIRINAVCGRVNTLINDGYICETKRQICSITNMEINPLIVDTASIKNNNLSI